MAADDGIILSRDYVINWYRKTQDLEGHPIELTYKENAIAYREMPYNEVLEFGLPDTPRDIILRFVENNVDKITTYKDVAEKTGINYKTVQSIMKELGFQHNTRWSTINNNREKELLKSVMSSFGVMYLSDFLTGALRLIKLLIFSCNSRLKSTRYLTLFL